VAFRFAAHAAGRELARAIRRQQAGGPQFAKTNRKTVGPTVSGQKRLAKPGGDLHKQGLFIAMPTYEYLCNKCGLKFEVFQSMTAAPLKLCTCGKKGKVKRLLGGGAGIIFKGSGFYETDYKRPARKGDTEKTGGADKAKSSSASASASPPPSSSSSPKP
jgi:putative FmdB family regulatory protein